MNHWKAAAFDLDDTLLHDDLSVSSRTVDIFQRLQRSGFIFIAASGRTRMSMQPFLLTLNCVSFCIACNGALIYNQYNGEILHQEMLPVDLCHEIAHFGAEHACYMQTYSDDRFYFNHFSEYSKKYAAASLLVGEHVGDLTKFIQEPRSKILMIADENKISGMLKEARKRFMGRASVTCSKACYLEFNPLQATKGNALRKCAEMLHISTEDILAFGDSLNDQSMLEIAGRSVAVANARPEILELCDDICPSNQEDGVASYLESNLIMQKEDSF